MAVNEPGPPQCSRGRVGSNPKFGTALVAGMGEAGMGDTGTAAALKGSALGQGGTNRARRTLAEVHRVLTQMKGLYDPGEAVDELSHALQCATLAVEACAPAALVAAALLHDVGRHAAVAGASREAQRRVRREGTEPQPGVHGDGTEPQPWGGATGREVPHEIAGARWLRPRFGQKVAWLVMAHVPAKMYLAQNEPGYLSYLSGVSLASLARQTGHHPALGRLSAHPWWEEALMVRRWDDMAKVPGARTMSLTEAVSRIAGVAVGD